MTEESECLHRATVCETLAGQAQDSSSARMLRDIAVQWRQLAHDTDRHKRMTQPAGESPREIERNRRRVA